MPDQPLRQPPSADVFEQDEQSLLVSYLTLRRIVGCLGIALPIVLLVAGVVLDGQWQPSISAYYDLQHPRDVLVGALFAIGFFLLTYRGYELADDVAGYLCFVFALGVALFRHDGRPVVAAVHFISASALFLCLAYYALFLFTKTSGVMTSEKIKRNRVYRTCGTAIVGCLLVIGAHSVYALAHHEGAKDWPVLFWLESLMLWAFGFSWLVKGETLWRDAGLPPPLKPAERRVP
jgi:hypothetical protein